MIAVDTNILLYAHRADSPFHVQAVRRLRELVEGDAGWAIPWPCVHEFIAVVTNRRGYQLPSSLEDALAFIGSVIESPAIVLISEAEDHWPTLRGLAEAGRIFGGRIHDARIAAICIEHQVAELWTADRDFARFPGLKAVNPLV